MNESELRKIVQERLNAGIDAGNVINKKWLAHEIVSSRSDVQGEDADFMTACSYWAIQKIAGDLIRLVSKQETEDDVDRQCVLPGFKHVRKFYSVVRGKEPCVVRTSDMGQAEVLKKADDIEAHGRGALEHADELRRYAEGVVGTGTEG